MNYYERPTPLQEQANTEAMQHFAEHLKQFKANCDALRRHRTQSVNDWQTTPSKPRCFRPAASSKPTTARNGSMTVDLTKITSVCHRRTAAGMEFAVVECLPLKSGEMKEVLNSGHNVREVLQAFMRDQRQVLRLWKEDVKAQVREHLDEKYPASGHEHRGRIV